MQSVAWYVNFQKYSCSDKKPLLFYPCYQLRDLGAFIVIIAAVIIGYGVASRSMAYYPDPNRFVGNPTNTSFDSRIMLRQIIYPVYYMLYGDASGERFNLDR